MTSQSTSSVDYIAVYILEGVDFSRSEAIRRLFNHPVFITYVVKIDFPEDWLQRYAHLSREDAEELYQYKWCLADARKRMPDNYVLVIKDTSTTNVTPQNLAELIVAACQNKTWQLCYLNKWHDRCDLYTDKVSLLGPTTILAKTHSPHGCQAILFSPEGRDIILNEKRMKNGQDFNVISSLSVALNQAISQGYIDATCFVPNLISFDLTSARQNSDYYKCQECRQPDIGPDARRTSDQRRETSVTQTDNGVGVWIWVLLILLILIGVLFLFSTSSRRYSLRYTQ